MEQKPTKIHLDAAEELELPLTPSSAGGEIFEDIAVDDILPKSPSVKKETFKKAPSKVKTAAAMFENSSTSTVAAISSQRLGLSPPLSYRSVPVGQGNSPQKSLVKLPVSPSGKSFLSSSPKPKSSPLIASDLAPLPPLLQTPSKSPPTTSIGTERFSEIPLADSNPSTPVASLTDSEESRRVLGASLIPTNLDKTPPISTIGDAASPIKENKSFFSSALGLVHANSQATPIEAVANPSSSPSSQSQHQSEEQSPNANSLNNGGWRSTMSQFLTRTTSSNSVSSHAPTPLPLLPSANSSHSTPSLTPTSTLLLHREDATPSRDRRLSKDLNLSKNGQESFERVRSEMDSAAREMRREREGKRTPLSANGSFGGNRQAVETIEEEDEDEVDWTFWGSVVQSFEEIAIARPKELSKAIQQGIPPVIRGAIWQLMASSKSTTMEENYKALLKLSSPHEKSITKDLNRTFPNHKYFKEGGGVGQESLFMVVKAYSIYDQEVGYTQGLTFIVAALLLNMPDEEAFCVLVRLMDTYNLRSHYTAEMHGLQLRLFQFDRLVEEILPLLHTHLVRKGVKSSMYASQWFMTLFSYRFPLSLVYRVLDIVFAEGIEAVFRFSLALLKKSEAKLVTLEFEQILAYLQADLFEVYRASSKSDEHAEESWKANDFVCDAFEIRITPLMLDAYASEWEEQLRNETRHAAQIDQLRNVNRNLSGQVKQLESSLAAMNQEHVELVRQLVMSKIEKEEAENELVRYKLLYAELAHAQQDALSVHSRLSAGSMSGNQQTSEISNKIL
ncbi:hypothetical protein L204_106105 [Cryptococcus depauperatus]|nr:hypothetical protein L204_05235 [Cryptococcus depauperatus CBS 7855]